MVAGVLLLGLWAVPAGAATDNGAASIVGVAAPHRPLGSGGSATRFTLKLGTNPTCPGDSATGQYRLQSFMVPSSADLDALTFDASGPVAAGDEFRQPLFDATSSPYVDELTDIAVPPAATGGVSGLPAFNFAVFSPGDVPAGEYSIGIACTLGPAGPSQLKSFWSATITVSARADDVPAGITWTGPAAAAAPSGNDDGGGSSAGGGEPSATTTPAGGGGGASTTTTPAGGGGGTTSTTAAGAGEFAGSEPSMSTVGGLQLTGSSPWYVVVWALFFVVIGRVVVLIGRRPKVRPPSGD
jgi:hypothetical protein